MEVFVLSMFNNCFDWEQFKCSVRDLLISLKSFSNSKDELYVEEKQTELEKARLKEQLKVSAIPGMVVKPSF